MTYNEIRERYKQLFISPIIQNCWIADVKRELGLTKHIAHNRKDRNSAFKPCPEKLKSRLKCIISGYVIKKIPTNEKIALKTIFKTFTVVFDCDLVFSDFSGKEYGLKVPANKNINISTLIRNAKMSFEPEYIEFRTLEYIKDVQIKFPVLNPNIIIL